MNAFVQSGQHQPNVNPDFCEIVVKRETILSDALTALMSQSEADLKKPLMVHVHCKYNMSCTLYI